jgi:hypothetical protein
LTEHAAPQRLGMINLRIRLEHRDRPRDQLFVWRARCRMEPFLRALPKLPLILIANIFGTILGLCTRAFLTLPTSAFSTPFVRVESIVLFFRLQRFFLGLVQSRGCRLSVDSILKTKAE